MIVRNKRPKKRIELSGDEVKKANICYGIMRGEGAASDAFGKPSKDISAAPSDDVEIADVIDAPQTD